jgi:hypothetical protein
MSTPTTSPLSLLLRPELDWARRIAGLAFFTLARFAAELFFDEVVIRLR